MPELSPLLDAAFARHQAGDLIEAVRLYKEIIAYFPLQPDALHMMGVIAKQQGNNELALKLIEVALGQRTDMALAWYNRALLLRLANRAEEALQSVEQATTLSPHMAEAWDLQGMLLRDKRDYIGSRTAHARAVELRPDDMKFLGNYALLLNGTGELKQAYRIMKRIEASDRDFMPQTMGNILRSAGYPDRAVPYFAASRQRHPDNDEVRITEAMTRLQIGDFAEGWKIWETRPSLDARFKNVPFWDGRPIDYLLLHEDQGIGDAFQFSRYITQLRGRTKHITLQVTAVLKKIFEQSLSGVDILTLDDPVPAADARIRLLSLPALFGANENNIPDMVPYLAAPMEDRRKWRSILEDIKKPNIGIVWGGNPNHLNDTQRSIPFEQMALLLQVGAKHLISLQKGAQATPASAKFGIFDASTHLNDFADTAALIAELDLIITVDTSVAHLAGALGKPVWLLLPFDPDWRWLLEREDSPWYPTMRLFRQCEPRNWGEVIARVTADLQRFINRDASVLQPKRWRGTNVRQNPLALKLDN